jgi:hypothetical protein
LEHFLKWFIGFFAKFIAKIPILKWARQGGGG